MATQPSRDEIRHAEVAREIAERGRLPTSSARGRFARRALQATYYDVSDADDWPAAEHALLMPPWRERLLDGSLGPDYGPRTEAALEDDLARYNEGIAAGGLWDHEEEARMRGRVRTPRRAERPDGAAMRRFVERHSHEIPARELETYFGFYLDGFSRRRLAQRMGVDEGSVASWLARLRERMARGKRGVKR